MYLFRGLEKKKTDWEESENEGFVLKRLPFFHTFDLLCVMKQNNTPNYGQDRMKEKQKIRQKVWPKAESEPASSHLLADHATTAPRKSCPERIENAHKIRHQCAVVFNMFLNKIIAQRRGRNSRMSLQIRALRNTGFQMSLLSSRKILETSDQSLVILFIVACRA